ncbi:cephalotocin receptor 2-like [Littorina saxatilis]|uniref:cephalotocin receptor 2-like n=1 Tax=Littorina saxatilis TaxID=31220 RepID=UPI0038B4DA65
MLRGRDEGLARIEITVLATIFALAVVGNVCVLVALGRRRKITSRMHMFILHLSVADLLVAFCNILPQLAWDITGNFRGGDVLCRVVTFLQVFVMYLSTYVLVMTAVDRYRAICYPLSNYSWTPRTVNVMIAAVYLLSALLSIPQPLLFRYQALNDAGDYDCLANFDPPWLLKAYILTFTILIYVAPFLVLVFTYGSICYTIWANQPSGAQQDDTNASSSEGKGACNEAGEMTPSSSSTPVKNGGGGQCYMTTTPVTTSAPSPRRWPGYNLHYSNGSLGGRVGRGAVVRPRAHSVRGFSRAKLKTVKLTFVVIVAYLLCWSPFFISQLWWLYDPAQEASKSDSGVVIMLLLSSLNSCCNPWIYLAFSGNLLRHLFPCLWPCCHSPAPNLPPFMLQTPSNSPQRLEMLVFRGRKKAAGDGANTQGAGGAALVGRKRDMYGTDGVSPAQKRTASSSVQQGSLSSLLTSRLSRNTSAGARQQKQRPAMSPVALTHSPNGDTLLFFERNGHASSGLASCDQTTNTSNGLISRKNKIPVELIIQAHDEEGPVSPLGRESGSSGSNPRSPHLFKRARLHERPAEELAEAQLKWEHNMGIRGPSIS